VSGRESRDGFLLDDPTKVRGWQLGKVTGDSALGMARSYAALIAFFVLFIVLSCTAPGFLEWGNLLNIASQQSAVAIVACAGTLVIIAGNFDLSTGSVVAVTNVIAAYITVRTGSVWIGLLSAPITGLVLGTINGIIITYLRVHSFLATLATSLVYSSLAVLITNGALISVSASGFDYLGDGDVGKIPVSVIVLAAFALIIMFILNRTVTGRHIFAVGGNKEAATLSGVQVNLTHIKVMALSGLASGIGGAILASTILSGEPTQGSSVTLASISAIILGGTSIYGGEGAVWRSLVGVFLLALIGNGFDLLGANQFYLDLVTGLVIVSAVALAASGRRR